MPNYIVYLFIQYYIRRCNVSVSSKDVATPIARQTLTERNEKPNGPIEIRVGEREWGKYTTI